MEVAHRPVSSDGRRLSLPRIGSESESGLAHKRSASFNSKADLLKREEKIFAADVNEARMNPKIFHAMAGVCERLQEERKTLKAEIEQLKEEIGNQQLISQSYRSRYEAEKGKLDFTHQQLEAELKHVCQLTHDLAVSVEVNREQQSKMTNLESTKYKLEECIVDLRRQLIENSSERKSPIEVQRVRSPSRDSPRRAQQRTDELVALRDSHIKLQEDLSAAQEQLARLQRELQSFLESPGCQWKE
eukprot:TRINITY_DN20423_c0_g1_i2.p1 TRINITY_DN20423_c0_g1~~TRINITY_DN20423_c0_g1_i2.p1  ORF type:complete len:268 (+),score=53.31 TRINITY_DN20423_c0_g1_i2:72-806(+)